MKFIIIAGIIAIICLYFYKKTEKIKKRVVGDNIEVICPHCGGRVLTAIGGKLQCPYCKTEFIYNANNRSSDEIPNVHHTYKEESKAYLKCPYCNSNLDIQLDNNINIQLEGPWVCSSCRKTFIYRGNRVYRSEDVCSDAVVIMITLLAKISKADGAVTQKEIALLENFLNNKLKLNYNQKIEVQQIFNRSKQTYSGYEDYLYKLYNISSNNKSMLVEFLEEMFKFSYKDNGVHIEQEKMLEKAAQIFRISTYEYNEIKNKFIQNLDKYYNVLNCNRNNTNEEIRSNYRKLIMKYHPDRYASKDLPEEMLNIAKEKTQEIQEAYETIRKSRNF